MQQNMGTADRVIRVLLAITVGVLYFFHVIGGILAIVLGVFAVVWLITSFVSFCPAYLPFKLSTKKREPST